MKMKKWSSQWTQFMQLRKEARKKFRTSTGFEPVTSRLPVRCSTNWAMKPLTLGPAPNVSGFTLTSGLWSISPNGVQLCCLATKHVIEEEEDLFLSKIGSTPQKGTPCNIQGTLSEYRRIYPQGCPFSGDGSMVASIRVVGGSLNLSITNTRNAKTVCSEKVSKVCVGFRGVVVDCAFPPNGQLLAVSSSQGNVYFLISARWPWRKV